jgi:ubiquinone/menaquinone biosynthesis C-methylase UbiE
VLINLFIVIANIKNIFRKRVAINEKGSAEAYDIWAENYDAQPGNLMLDLDEIIFPELLSDINITGKKLADIGCGTGRHWAKILQQEPHGLTGFDVSAGMLRKLKNKFPQAHTSQITDNLFSAVPDATFDVIVSTLTVAHIEYIEEALQAWSRILKKDGELIITDFHPDALARGGKRTFDHNKSLIAVENFVHPVTDIESNLTEQGFNMVKKIERVVDASVQHYYAAKNAMHVYNQFENCPIIYGLHLKRG